MTSPTRIAPAVTLVAASRVGSRRPAVQRSIDRLHETASTRTQEVSIVTFPAYLATDAKVAQRALQTFYPTRTLDCVAQDEGYYARSVSRMTYLRLLLATFALPLFATVVSGQSQKAELVPIFITSAGAANGLTDPSKDNRDSVKDVADELKKHKTVVEVVTSQADAAIVVTIIGRERTDVLRNQGVLGLWREVYVKARLSYKATDAEVKGLGLSPVESDASSGMKAAGRELAKQVVEWVRDNWATIMPGHPVPKK